MPFILCLMEYRNEAKGAVTTRIRFWMTCLAIDTGIGVFCVLCFLGQLTETPLSWLTLLAISVGAWGAYLMDRIIDNYQFSEWLYGQRHRYLRGHNKLISFGLSIICVWLFFLFVDSVFFLKRATSIYEYFKITSTKYE